MHEDPIICRCEEVRRSEIETAVSRGSDTVDTVKRRTRAGMGICQGKFCACHVAAIIAGETGKPAEALPPGRNRPPVIPVSLQALAADAE